MYVPNVGRLRGGRQGAAAPPAPPAQGYAPGNPDSMHVSDERPARMPAGRSERQLIIEILASQRHAPVL